MAERTTSNLAEDLRAKGEPEARSQAGRRALSFGVDLFQRLVVRNVPAVHQVPRGTYALGDIMMRTTHDWSPASGAFPLAAAADERPLEILQPAQRF
jgi:hypothetical protein